MKRLTISRISTYLVGIVGALALAFLLFSGGPSAHAVTCSTDPTPGSIYQVSVDTNVINGGTSCPGNLPGTGDGALVGPVDPVIGGVALGGTQTVDVIIDEIAVQDGLMSAFQFNLLYNQAVVHITSESALPYMIGAGASQVSATCPTGAGCLAHADTTGNLLIEWAHFDGTGVHYGEGMLVRLTVQCIGTSAGFSPLTLTDTAPGGQGAGTVRIYTTANTNGDPSVQMPVTNVNSGAIYCGEPAPSLSDLQVNNTTVTIPSPGIAGSNFNVLVNANVQNNGPTGPTMADVNETLIQTDINGVPLATPDCTITPPTMPVVIPALAVDPPAPAVAVPQQTFVVNCALTSNHYFTSTATISVDPTDNPPHTDNVAANNSATSAVATTAVTATADPAIISASTSSSAPIQCLPQVPPAPTCVSLPVVTIGQPQTVTVHKVIQNLSGYSPVPVSDAVTYVGALQEPSGAAATCTVTPTNLGVDPNPHTTTLTGTGPASQQTLDFQFTATCSTNSFYDSHNPQAITLLFVDVLSMNDPSGHITDCCAGNNVLGNNPAVPIAAPFWNRAPFTPAFTFTKSSTQGPDTNTVLPTTHICVTNILTPVGLGPLPGIPCEMYQTTAIPAGDPLALATVILPASDSIANGNTVPNGTPSAYFGFLLNLDGSIALGGPPSVCNIPVGASGVQLLNAAIPPQPTLAGGSLGTLTSLTTYPSDLNFDPVVAALLALPTPPVLWARYTGVAPIPGNPTAVNILVFNAGASGWITVTVTGDPSPPGPATPVGEQCTPFSANVDFLGSAPVTGQVLRTCNAVGPEPVLANWIRGDTFETYGPSGTPPVFIPGVTMDVTNSCTPSDTSVTLTKNETLGSVSLGAAGSPNGGVTYTQNVNWTVVGSSDLTLSLVGPTVCNPQWISPVGSSTQNIGGTTTSVVDLGVVSGSGTATYSFNCPPGDYSFQIVANLAPLGSENTANNQFENNVLVHVATGCGEPIACGFSGINVDTITTTACVMSGTTPVNCDATVAGTTTGGGIMVPDGSFTGALHDDWTVYTASAPCAAVTGTFTSPVTLTSSGWSGTLNPGAFFCEVVAGSTYSFTGTIQLNGSPGGAVLVSMACTHTSGTTPATNVYTCTSTFSGGDQCPGVNDPESGGPDPSDGTTVSNGCPDTNVSVTATKEENYSVNVSQDTQKSVSITVSNSEYPANVVVNITAVSLVGQCEVRLTPHAGDTSSTYTTTEPGGNTLTSQVSFVIPNMAAASSQTFVYTYTIHCFQKSFHPAAFELQIDALPQAPVVEENLGAGPACPSPWCTPAVVGNPTDTNNNVYKNFPNVTAWETVEVAKGPCALTSPDAPNGTTGNNNFTLQSTCTVTDSGPYTGPLDVTDTATLSLPSDCTITTAPANNPAVLHFTGVGSQVVTMTWVVQCANPSFHSFTVNDSVSINAGTPPLHVYDVCPGPGPVPGDTCTTNNNTGSASVLNLPIRTTSNPNLVAGALTCTPSPAEVGQTITCTETDSVALYAATGGTLTATLSGPADCTIAAPNPVTQAAVNGNNTVTWSVVCSSSSNHTFTKNVLLTTTLPLHVSDSNLDDNRGTASTTVEVFAHANLAITVSNASPVDLLSGSSTIIHPVVTITNLGGAAVPISWNVSITSGGAGTVGCTVSAITEVGPVTGLQPGSVILANGTVTDTYTATITMPTGDVHECSYTISASVDATGSTHNVGHAFTTSSYILETNVLHVKYAILVGPAAVNLSDTNGRYMWVIAEIGNLSTTTELVRVNMSILQAVPVGCTSSTSQILPGQAQFQLSAGEQKVLVWRVRYECHAPALAQVINQTVTVGVTHCDLTTSNPNSVLTVGTVTPAAPGGICSANSEPGLPAGDVETVLSDNTVSTTRQVIIQ